MERKLTIEAIEKLMRVNHDITGDIQTALGNAYDKGMGVGKLKKALGMDYGRYAKHVSIDGVMEDAFKLFTSVRTGNKRNLKYDGPDIAKGSEVLVCDFTLKQAIRLMQDKDHDYMYFERERFDKAYHEDSLKRTQNDPEETEYLTWNYNNLEVKIFLMKCFQIGFSAGEIAGSAIPRPVVRIFDLMRDIDDHDAGKKGYFKDEAEKEMMREYLEKQKLATPDWVDYKSYYNK